MRLGVLGPLLVIDEAGARVPMTTPRLRVLLATLMLHANTPVSAETLADSVWDGSPPGGAAITLRTYIRRLRTGLTPGWAERIVTSSAGYLCRVDEDEADTLRFEALCLAADTAVREQRWEQASQATELAAGLWRGEPLLDVPSRILRDEFTPRFEQLHVHLLENQVEAALALGRGDPWVQPLRELVVAHPLRERFHAQLMLALARTGRQAEALAAYREAHRMLSEELGIEPGPELRRLHERILAGDAGLLASAGDTAEPGQRRVEAQVPRQLPAAVRHFIGRHGELDLLTGLGDPAGRAAASGGTVVISAIDGMAGIGKTALAVHTAHRLADAYPDGQLFLDLHGYTRGRQPRTAGEALDWLLRALGVPAARIPEDGEQAAALYRQRLARTRTLIVLDNAADEAQVRPLLPGGGDCLVLITSRRRLKGMDDAHAVPLNLLSTAEATALLRAVAGPARIATDDPLLGEIADLCGRLPLALRIAGALLLHRPSWPLEHLAGQLRERHQRIRALSDGERDLSTAFDLSYYGLDELHRRIWRRLGVNPGDDLDAHAAAAVAQTDPATAARLLEDLVDHNLLLSPAPGRYQLHDLLRDHARDLVTAEPEPERDGALDRLLHYYAHTAQVASTSVARYPRTAPEGPAPAHAPRFQGPEAARTWLRAERDNIEAAYLHARELGLDRHVLSLAAGLAVLLTTDGPFNRGLELYRSAVETAERHGDPAAHATALTDLGILQRLTGDLAGAAAGLSRAREIARAAGRTQSGATALTELSIVLRLTGDNERAGEAVQQALELYRASGNRQGEATALSDLGVIGQVTGDLAGATEALARALEIYRAIGFHNGEADALADLGIVRQLTGDLAGAVDFHTQALELYRRIGHRHGEATTLTRLGIARQLTGDLAEAAASLAQALEIYRAIGQRSGEAYALTELGVVQLLAGDPSTAADFQVQALKIFRASSQRGNEATVLNRYAAAVAAGGDPPRAREYYQQALEMNRRLNKPDDEAIALEGLAGCDVVDGDDAAAAGRLHEALEIFERLGMDPDTSRVRERLDQLARTGWTDFSAPSPSAPRDHERSAHPES
jgi:DNA-binding SARP family transcriptional activator